MTAKQKVAESGVLRACLDLLAAEKVWHLRMNTGAMKAGKRFTRFGRPGTADILASPTGPARSRRRHSNGTGPVFSIGGITPTVPKILWIECKSDSGCQSEQQKEFQKEALKAGHHYLLVRDVDTLRDWLKAHGGN